MSGLSANWFVDDAINEVAKGVIKSYLRGVKGHVAEFGTMSGRSAKMLAYAIASSETIYESQMSGLEVEPRDLYLFDSFQGLPEAIEDADLNTPLVMNGTWGAGTCYVLNPEQLRGVCSEHLSNDRIHIAEGWFSDTMSQLRSDLEFAFIHVDCDLYSSTRDVLDGLFSQKHVAEGALIYFDDWDCNASRPDLGERLAWSEAVKKYNINYSPSHSYAVFGHAIVVHDYDSVSS